RDDPQRSQCGAACLVQSAAGFYTSGTGPIPRVAHRWRGATRCGVGGDHGFIRTCGAAPRWPPPRWRKAAPLHQPRGTERLHDRLSEQQHAVLEYLVAEGDFKAVAAAVGSMGELLAAARR